MKFLCCFCVTIFVFFETSALYSQDISNLITRVEAIERVFDKMEASFELTKRSELESKSPMLLKLSTSSVTVKWCGEKHRGIDSARWEMGDGSKKPMLFDQGFDGDKTMINSFGEIGNIVDQNVAPYSVIPTAFGYPQIGRCLRLSQVLDFDQTMLPSNPPLRWKKATSRLLGKEEKNGLNCLKIEVLSNSRISKNPNGRHVLWISPERSFQVVASNSFSLSNNDSVPIQEFEVTDWLEFEIGFWIPKSSKGSVFQFSDDGKRFTDLTEEYNLLSIKRLEDPQASKHYNVSFPEGLEVLVIESGEYVRSEKDGEIVTMTVTGESLPEESPDYSFWIVFAIGNLIIFSWVYVSRLKRSRVNV